MLEIFYSESVVMMFRARTMLALPPPVVRPLIEQLTDVTISKIYVNNTDENTKLDTLKITPTSLKFKQQQDIKVILVLPDYFEDYTDKIDELSLLALKHNCKVITFNYRATNNSLGVLNGKSCLVNDCITQLTRLKKSFVKPENIIIKGSFLGATIAAEAAALCHSERVFHTCFPVYLYCDRPYNNIDLISLKKADSNYMYLQKIQSRVNILPLIYDTAYYYNLIPAKYKVYTFLATDKPDTNSIDRLVDNNNNIHAWGFTLINNKLYLSSNSSFDITSLFSKFVELKVSKFIPKGGRVLGVPQKLIKKVFKNQIVNY